MLFRGFPQHSEARMKSVVAVSVLLAAAMGALCLRADAPSVDTSPVRATAPPAQTAGTTNPAFLEAADEVLGDMSKLVDLPIKSPLKRSLRSKDEIRAFVMREDKDDKDDAKRYADDKSLEAFGLIPKGFPLDSFMVDVLTEQIAGLYDPKGKEFYIADWIPADQQKDVMAHELTHALEDQSFNIDPWMKAPRPNDDAELARDAVSEGSAMAAMLDYALKDQHLTVRQLPDVDVLIRAGALSDMDNDPKLSKAPAFIRDSLVFPYLAGVTFTQQFLKQHTGWADLKIVFEHPPISTQQIMEPQKYFDNVKPNVVSLPDFKGLVPADWKLLDQNVMGEFGVHEVLKQFLGEDSAKLTAPAWAGDRYAVFENTSNKTLPLVFQLDLDNAEDAARFFGQYSSALEIKYPSRHDIVRRPNFFTFQSDDGSVFLRCSGVHCLAVEATTIETFDKINHALGWTDPPKPDSAPAVKPGIAQLYPYPAPNYRPETVAALN
jgi:hypothetical protein